MHFTLGKSLLWKCLWLLSFSSLSLWLLSHFTFCWSWYGAETPAVCFFVGCPDLPRFLHAKEKGYLLFVLQPMAWWRDTNFKNPVCLGSGYGCLPCFLLLMPRLLETAVTHCSLRGRGGSKVCGGQAWGFMDRRTWR